MTAPANNDWLADLIIAAAGAVIPLAANVLGMQIAGLSGADNELDYYTSPA